MKREGIVYGKNIKLLEADCRLTNKEIATMLSLDELAVASARNEYESKGIILGYKACIDWEKTDNEKVHALIELKVTPQFGEGLIKLQKEFISTLRWKAFI
jgi:DNA-binding Lrp family transcriptional regulator